MEFSAFKRLKTNNYALHNNLLSAVSAPRTVNYIPSLFTKEVIPQVSCSNQKSTGRCWIFAAMNMLRRPVIKEYKLPESFEFSQSYIFFFDKLERMNYNLMLIEKFKSLNNTVDNRLVQHILKDPFGDGGQWIMFSNIANKYGLVPKEVYPESVHSSNSAGVNIVLSRMFRTYVKDIYIEKFDKTVAIQKTYEVLVRFFGEPPTEFNWEYKISDNTSTSLKSFNGTPLNYMKSFCKIDLSDYVSLTHDPRNDINKLYSVQYLGNVEGGEDVKYLNIDIKRMRDLTKKTIDENTPVWFGSDVGQFYNASYGLLDEQMFDYNNFLELQDTLNKRQRIEYCESLMTHAMVYVGYHEDQYGQIDYWKIENSWGPDGPKSGHLVCSDKWFKEYTYQLILPKRLLNKEELDIWNGQIDSSFPIWDPMGALA